MISAPVGLTKPEAGVMATRPATAPETMPRTDGFLAMIHSATIQARAAAAVAIWVAAAAMPAWTLEVDRRAGVEAEPADPQQRGADDAVGQVVRGHVLGAQALALAEHQGGDQARGAGVQVHDGAAGEVERAHASPSQPPPQTQWAIGQ